MAFKNIVIVKEAINYIKGTIIDKNDPKTRLYLLSSDGKKATIKEIHITKVSKTIKAVLMLF